MHIHHTLLGLVITILLVTSSSYGQPLNENVTNDTSPVTTLITSPTTSFVNITTVTTVPITTTSATSEPTITTNSPTTITNATNPTTSITTAATATTVNSSTTASTSTSTKSIPPATKAPGRKFDGLSFIGGMILAAGLSGILYLVVSYLRRNNELPYANLR